MSEPPDDARAWADAAPCGLMQTSEDGTFLDVNRTFCLWLGRAPEELVGKRRFQDLLTPGGRIFHQTHWNPLLHMQGSVSEVKLDLVHQDGTTIPMMLNAMRRQQTGGTVHHLAAYIARDRDKYERELVASRQRLEVLVAEANRHQEEAKDRALFAEQMIGIVSHDLRNPLATITMATALLVRGELSESQQRTASRIGRATERATRLIADLLDFTQARLGKGLSISKSEIDLHAAVSDHVDELAHTYPGRIIEHVRAGQGSCFADADRLAQLVGNLVSNAVTHGDSERAITVNSTIEGDSFTVAVHNWGAAIPSEVQGSIFEAMTRGEKAPAAGRSVGLGLFIVREIAKAHGGRAEVESNAEHGTTFCAIFPRN
ncbi:MAG TPA: PAS domain-containing sensor histidine kinase [Polyangiaceae bacterium]|nr:PAS domain-containing sensor histidine kinase [Polyangiaceae bacterium]